MASTWYRTNTFRYIVLCIESIPKSWYRPGTTTQFSIIKQHKNYNIRNPTGTIKRTVTSYGPRFDINFTVKKSKRWDGAGKQKLHSR